MRTTGAELRALKDLHLRGYGAMLAHEWLGRLIVDLESLRDIEEDRPRSHPDDCNSCLVCDPPDEPDEID